MVCGEHVYGLYGITSVQGRRYHSPIDCCRFSHLNGRIWSCCTCNPVHCLHPSVFVACSSRGQRFSHESAAGLFCNQAVPQFPRTRHASPQIRADQQLKSIKMHQEQSSKTAHFASGKTGNSCRSLGRRSQRPHHSGPFFEVWDWETLGTTLLVFIGQGHGEHYPETSGRHGLLLAITLVPKMAMFVVSFLAVSSLAVVRAWAVPGKLAMDLQDFGVLTKWL